MNWQHIIDNGRLVYQSQEADTTFRNWALKVTRCKVSYYETFPLANIDKVICAILQEHDGIMEEYELATILGFNVKDNFDIIPKRYADVAELQLFRAIVKSVLDWGLISKCIEKGIPVTYFLTELGKRAIERKEKYKFFNGQKVLFENSGIKAVSLEDSTFFPFFKELNICSEITNPTEEKYENIDIHIFDLHESELIRSIQLQSEHHYNIFKAEKTNYFNFESKKVDVCLYSFDNTYYPIIFHNNDICHLATDLLNNDANIELKNKKVEWGLYLRLMNDENAVLDYNAISPFEDILELDDLIKDKRLCWNDDELFSFISNNANADQISLLSNYCPIDIIKRHIADDGTSWDWLVLSKRIDGEFILNNPLFQEDKESGEKYSPWNYEIISSREDVDIETIKKLLQKPELNEVEWDWEIIMPQLDFNFIKNHIAEVNFDLLELTKEENESIKQLVREFPSKHWDWQYISESYDLGFILENIRKFIFSSEEKHSNWLNLKTIFNRAFTSVEYSEKYCKSTDIKAVASLCKDSLSDFSANISDFIWSYDLIDFLETIGLLTWQSGYFTDGFECNPYVKWDEEYFNRYCSKVTTEKGFEFVSKAIKTPKIVIDNPNFNWNWETLSRNKSLISNNDFVSQFIGKFCLDILLPNIQPDLIESFFVSNGLLELLGEKEELWTIVTKKVSIEFVRKNLNFCWDWNVLTQRFYTTINIKALGNERWIDKWDWNFLTQNLDLNVVIDNLNEYQDYWDWEFLSNKLDKDFILNNLPDYVTFWDWNTLIESRFDKSDLSLSSHLVTIATCMSVFEYEKQNVLWSIITRKFSTKELSQLINSTNQLGINSILFKWDYEYFYALPDFDVRQYLDDYIDDVNWDALSKSSQLNKELVWDNELYGFQRWIENTRHLLENEGYNWNFKALSQLDSINSYIDILSIRTAEWDWVYLTQNSKAFDDGKFFNKNFKLFKNYIDFPTLSARQNSGVTQKTIEITINKNWDWAALSQNTSIEFDIKFIKEQSTKPWDWQALSPRTDITINNESLFELVDKDWDWQIISTRQDVVFDEDCIKKLYDKHLNWFVVSQSNSFIPNQTTLSLLKNQKLNWDAISQNPKFDTSVLWDYKDILNWRLVTKNKIDCGDLRQLEKYQEYIDWRFVSASDKFELSNINLNKFKQYLDWYIINNRIDFVINNDILNLFGDVIDWNKASESRELVFTEELIEQYRSKWNWQILRQNPRVIEKLDSALNKYKVELNCVSFVERFPQRPYVYHFTHLFNAVEIIKNRKILSRNRAEGNFANAAGNLVERRKDAHNYARFYYRPQTPTQFYNECLGWDSLLQTSWGKSYYSQAVNLGLPKCPMPVFFKFDLSEVVSHMADKCYYSTGNMQTNWAKVLKISDIPDGLNTQGVYSTIQDGINVYKEYSQQEFLVLDEFDFSNLHSFEIICYDEEQAEILKSQLVGDDIVDKITSNSYGIFHRNNREISFYENGNTISISANYKGNAHFEINCQDKNVIQRANVIKETSNKVYAYPSLEITKTSSPIEIRFIDESNRSWVIYKNNSQYTMTHDKQHSLLWKDFQTHTQILLYKNWLLFSFFKFPIIDFLWDDSHGIDELLKMELNFKAKDFAEEEQLYNNYILSHTNVSQDILEDIMDLEFVAMDSSINDLFDFSCLKELKVLDFHCLNESSIYDFSPLKNDIFVLDYADYSIIDFSKQTNIEQCNNIKYIKGVGWQPIVTDIIKSIRQTNCSILSYFCNKYDTFQQLYSTKVRHYTIRQHTELVCMAFEKYFGNEELPINKVLFRIFLTIHDIGKPQAESSGDRSLQHFFTKQIINNYDLSYYDFTIEEFHRRILLTLADNDCVGEFFQGKSTINKTVETLRSMAEGIKMSCTNFFYLFMIYYQCDVAAYTKDEGGFPFLEKIFEYDDAGHKIFDSEERLLKMTPDYRQMYCELKKRIYDSEH